MATVIELYNKMVHQILFISFYNAIQTIVSVLSKTKKDLFLWIVPKCFNPFKITTQTTLMEISFVYLLTGMDPCTFTMNNACLIDRLLVSGRRAK